MLARARQAPGGGGLKTSPIAEGVRPASKKDGKRVTPEISKPAGTPPPLNKNGPASAWTPEGGKQGWREGIPLRLIRRPAQRHRAHRRVAPDPWRNSRKWARLPRRSPKGREDGSCEGDQPQACRREEEGCRDDPLAQGERRG